MPISRTAWTDDDGSGFTGEIIDNDQKTELYDQIDDALAALEGIEQTTTLTGNQDNFALTAGCVLLRCNNATLLTLRGLAAGVPGQVTVIQSVGAGQVNLAHQNVNSLEAARFINFATSGDTPLAAGVGVAVVQYDGTTDRWRLVSHKQGAWITATYSDAHFTGDGTDANWVVESGDLVTMAYYLRERTLTAAMQIVGADVAGTPTQLRIANGQWGGFTATKTMGVLAYGTNASVTREAVTVFVSAAGTTINWEQLDAGTWTNTTADNTTVVGQLSFEVN